MTRRDIIRSGAGIAAILAAGRAPAALVKSMLGARMTMVSGAKRLPYDAEVEYLESTGTQWIDTGIVPTANTNIRLTYETLIGGSESNAFFGSRIAANNSAFSVMQYFYNGGRKLRWNYGSVITNFGDNAGLSGVHILSTSGNSATLDGVTTVSGGSFSPNGKTIWIFAINNNGAALVPHKGLRVYAFQIYDGNTLVRDYIPVRVGNVGYMYDRVSGKLFGNQGTGDFVVGPDVVPVEWLGSDGNQYIDTGYVFQFGDDVSATFQPLATPTQTAYFFGADTAYNAGLNVHYDPGYSGNGLRYCYGSGLGASNSGVIMSPAQAFSTSTIYACNGNTNKRTINSGENTASVQDSGLNSASVILFCGRRNAAARPASTGWAVASRFYGFGVTRNGADIRAMKPIRVGVDATSWEGAMMDTLTRRIYRNAGTGAFVVGPDK